MKVPFLDVGATYRELAEPLDAAYRRVMESGYFVLGPETEAFEEEFARYSGCEYGIGVGSGLDALVIVLKAIGIGSGDSVIVPHHTFVATWSAVMAVGATPLGCPVDQYYNMDVSALASLVRTDTKAIIPVHLYGLPANMPEISRVADKYGLFILGDAAQAHGAKIGERPVGSFGHAAAFSFYPGKNLGAFGDGGMITTDSADLAAKCKIIRNYGSRKKYHHDVLGLNSRLDELQSALLRVKLEVLDDWNDRRKAIAARYQTIQNIQLPRIPADYCSSWHLFVVSTDHRDDLKTYLDMADVETLIHYPIPPAAQKSLEFLGQCHEPTVKLAHSILSLPIGPHLTDEQAEYVVETVCLWSIT